jgi:uncharacterized protein
MQRPRSRRAFVRSFAALTCAPVVASAHADAGGWDSSPGYLILYRPGPAFIPGKPLSEQPLKEHGQYMMALHRRGTLRIAGGFADDTGGAALIDAPDLDAAEAIAQADPAVIAKVFSYELHLWRLVPWHKLTAPK